MRKSIYFLISAILISMFAARAQARHMNVITVHDLNQDWLFRSVTVVDDGDAVKVSGRIITPRFSVPASGHIDVAVYDRNGVLIAEKPVNYYPALLTQRVRHKGGLRFSAKFSGVSEAGSVIKVAFHPNPPFVEAKPVHKATVAR